MVILVQFAVILSVVLVLEVSAAVAAYVLRAQVADMLDQNLRDTLPAYYDNLEVQDGFDFIQSRVRGFYKLLLNLCMLWNFSIQF